MKFWSLYNFTRILGTLPPVEGDTPPAEGDTPPADGTTPPAEGDTPPAEGDTPPAEGTTPPVTGGEMQDILAGLRDSLDDRDTDVSALTDSVRSLVDAMSVTPLSVDELPFDGWEGWEYPVTMDFTVYPWGAGRYMEQSETFNSPDAFLTRYNEILALVGNAGDGKSLKDFYVRYIRDGDGSTVYDYEAQTEEPEPEITVPFAGWESWSYPVTMDFTVPPWGAGYDMEQTETLDTAEAFRARYGEIVELCKDGGTLKDFYVRRIRDNDGNTVYDYQTAEEPEENLHPAILETLASMDAHLAAMDSALADIASVSENSIAYYENGLKLCEQANELAAHTLAVDLALLFVLVLMLGHRIAQAFWQRMKVG